MSFPALKVENQNWVVEVGANEIAVITVGVQGLPAVDGISDHGALTGLGDDDHTQYLNNARGDARYQPLATVLTNTTASFTTAQESKLAGIEAGADVTDATNVNAAGAVMNSDYSPAHSLLVQQSGTGSPTALSVGNNTLLGRLSGGGSDIDDLSASQVRTLLNVADGAEANVNADWNAGSGDAQILNKPTLGTAAAQDVGYFAAAAQANATHTGDATGATALTLASAAITGKTAATPVGADYILISDTSDSGNLKKALISDLPSGGGTPAGSTGEIQFNNAGAFGADANLFWDDTNNRLGIGTNAPSTILHVFNNGVDAQIRLERDATHRLWITSSSALSYISQISAVPLEFRTANTNRLHLTAAGLVGVNTSTPVGQFGVFASTDATIGAVIRGAASQTANLQEWQNSAGTVLASVGSAGQLSLIPTASAPERVTITKDGTFSYISASVFYANTGGGVFGWITHNRNLGSTGLQLLSTDTIRFTNSTSFGTADTGLARNAAGILEVNNGTPGTFRDFISRYVYLSGTSNYLDATSGNFRIYSGDGSLAWQSGSTTQSFYKNATFTPSSAAGVPIVAKGAASQTANLQEWQNSVGTVLSSITSGGNLTLSGLTINPTNGALTFVQTFAIVMQTSNAFIIRHGNNDFFSVRPVSASGTYSPSGYGACAFINTSNAVGAYLTPTAAGILEVRTAAHGKADVSLRSAFWSRTATAASVSSAGETIIGVTSTAAARTITLSTADVDAGRIIYIKDESGGAGTNNITIDTQGTELIDGAASISITVNYGVAKLYSDGTNWYTL